jgi:hypothetical protein
MSGRIAHHIVFQQVYTHVGVRYEKTETSSHLKILPVPINCFGEHILEQTLVAVFYFHHSKIFCLPRICFSVQFAGFAFLQSLARQENYFVV